MNEELLWSCEEFDFDEDFALNSLVEEIKHFIKGDSLIIIANKVDWTGRSGYRRVVLAGRTNEKIFSDIFPSYDCTFKLYKDDDGIYAVVSSHDIPTGAIWRFESEELEDEK